MKNRIFRVLKNPYILLRGLITKRMFHWLPDQIVLKINYKARMKKTLNLEKPTTFNEKLQWLKLNDRNPIYTQLVDKYEVRKYIKEMIGDDYLVPLYGIWDSFDEIDFSKLPNQFVLKTTHDSGGVVICKDKQSLNITETKKKINKSLKRNYYYGQREWPYKNVKPRIIAEKYMNDNSDKDLKDYKFFCFKGEPKLMFIASERSTATKFDFFDMDFNNIPIQQGYPNSKKLPKKPYNFEYMKELARKLSSDFPHVRVDFYEINNKVYFGEMTFYHFSGFEPFYPEEYDYFLGEFIKLPD